MLLKSCSICFVTWAVRKNQPLYSSVCYSSGLQKSQQQFFCCSPLVANWAESLYFVPQKWGTSENFEKRSRKLSLWIRQKSALFSSFRRNQRWFLALKIFVFSVLQSWISAVQRFSCDEQRWNRPENILNQSWSALNVFEASTRMYMYTHVFLTFLTSRR